MPAVPAAGGPPMCAVPELGAAVKLTPVGSAPLLVMVDAGFTGVVVMLRLPMVRRVNVVSFALVNFGATGGGPAFGSVMAMSTCAVFEAAEPVLAFLSEESVAS